MSLINHESIDPLLLEKICILYNIKVNDLELITIMDNNFVYSYQKADKKYFLRGGTRHTSEQILAELDWIQFLDSHGVNVSLPIQSKNGKFLEVVEFNTLLINSVVFEGAPGKQVDPSNINEWNEDIWKEMGKTLGKMHSAAVIYNSILQEQKRRNALESVIANAKKILITKVDQKILKKFQILVNKLFLLPKDARAFGLIQYDFHCENFNVHNGQITVYDFDDSHYFFFIYDLAACIHEAVWDNPDDKKVDFANRFIPALWKGYSSVFILDRKWLEFLPDFLKWREFDIYITLVESFQEKSVPKFFFHKIEEIMLEFRERVESNKQIIPILDDLEIWFPKH